MVATSSDMQGFYRSRGFLERHKGSMVDSQFRLLGHDVKTKCFEYCRTANLHYLNRICMQVGLLISEFTYNYIARHPKYISHCKEFFT